MLAAEGALLLLLRRRVRPLESEFGPFWSPGYLQEGIAHDVLAGRRIAADRSYRELVRELEQMGIEAAPLAIPWTLEYQRAVRASQGFVRTLQRHVARAGLEDVEEAARDAAGWARTHAEITAATEVSETWTATRDRVISETVERYPHLRTELFKVWDSELDKNTCDICANAHGAVVPIDEDFPEGTPGAVHIKCQCEYHIITGEELKAGLL